MVGIATNRIRSVLINLSSRGSRVGCNAVLTYSLTWRQLLPLAVFFLPIVKRLAVDLVHRCLSDFHFTRLTRQKEINVVSLSVCCFHVHTSEIFTPAEVLQAIVVHLYQIERQVLTFMLCMKLAVTAFFAFRIDILLDAGRNVRRANLFFRFLGLPGF